MLVQLTSITEMHFQFPTAHDQRAFCKLMSSTWRRHSDGRKIHIPVSWTYLKARARSERMPSGLRPQRRRMPPNVSYGPERDQT